MRKLSLMLYCLIMSNSLFGQITNKLNIGFNYRNSVMSQDFPDKFYTADEIGISTILSSINSNNGYFLVISYPNLSSTYQPSLLLGHNSYQINGLVVGDFAYKVDLNSNSFGFGNKINLSKRKYSIIPYLKGNILISNYKLIIDRPIDYFVAATGESPNTWYEINIGLESSSNSFIVPSFEVSMGIDMKLGDKTLLFTEFLTSFAKFPTIDVESPKLFYQGFFSIGLMHKILRNKRYYLNN